MTTPSRWRARATIDGPYEMHPHIHLITSKDAPDARLQRAGHGQIVETPDGEFYHTHLCSRPLPGTRRSPLGRETAIQKCVWGDDGWLYLADGGQVPSVEVEAPAGTARIAGAAPRPLRFFRRRPACRFPVAAHARSGAHLLALGQAGRAQAARPRIDRQLVRAGAGGAAAAAFLAAHRDGARLPAGHVPAGGRADALLQQAQVPFPCRQLRRAARPHADDHVLSGRLAGRQAVVPARRGDRRCPAMRRSGSPRRSTARSCSSSTAPAIAGWRSARCSTPA